MILNPYAFASGGPPPSDYRTNLAAEWDADNITGSDEDLVATWPETIASNDATQASGSERPKLQVAEVNGHNAVEFDPLLGSFMDSAYADSLGDFTAFAVFRKDASTSAAAALLSKGYVNEFWIGEVAVGYFDGEGFGSGCKKGDNAPYLTPISVTDGIWVVMSMRRSGTAWTLRINGTATTASATVSADALSSASVVFGKTPSSGFIAATAAQFRIYNAALSDSNRLAVEQFLGSVYNITITP
jgi:hypothetical protein